MDESSTDTPRQGPVGSSVSRHEDARLIRGQGQFVDDVKKSGMCYLNLVRSPYAHARISDIDTSRADEHPGVLTTLTGEDMRRLMDPLPQIGGEPSNRIEDFAIPAEKVRYQGDPVAAVVASSRMAAEDAAEMIQVDYQVLEPITGVEQALEDEHLVHEEMETNQIFRRKFDHGDVDRAFEQADHVIEIDRLHFERFTAAPLENNAVIATWDGSGSLTLICNSSFPAVALQFLSMSLGVPVSKMELRTEDIGGSFGIKTVNHNYLAIAAVASRATGGRPVKWVESRSEHLTASAQSTERVFRDIRVALDDHGVITAFDASHVDDVGAYTRLEPQGAVLWGEVPTGNYRIQHLRIDFRAVVTNKCPVGPVRGYARMQHIWFVERILDISAHEMGIPADEMRMQNYIPPDDFPWETPNKNVYDSGNYPAMLEKAKKLIGWDAWQEKKERARNEGRWVGVGIGTTLDGGANNFSIARAMDPQAPFSGQSEAARVELEMDGSILVTMGTAPAGQGHETTAAQIVASELNVPPDAVNVRTGFDSDTGVFTGHSGTYASQFAVTGLSAVHGALERLKTQMKEVGGWALQAEDEELTFGMGEQGPEIRVPGSDNSLPLWKMANLVHANNQDLPVRMAENVDLSGHYVFRPDFGEYDPERGEGKLCLTYASQLVAVVLEVDRDTYHPRILDFAVVDDCGTVINPQIVEGLVHGASCHGLGSALLERCEYDSQGNMLNSTFSDYVPMTSLNMPSIKYGDIETPSPFTFNGAKGMAEGGGAPIHAVCAALQDALIEQDVVIQNSHNSPSDLHEIIQQRTSGQWDEVVRRAR